MHEYEQSNDIAHSAKISMTGFVVGAVVGAGIALLLAPATGEETRRRLGETAKRLKDDAAGAIDKARETFQGDGKDDSKSRMGMESEREGTSQHRPMSQTSRTGSTTSPGARPA